MLTNFFHGYPYPFLPVSGGVITAGQWGDLKHAAGSVSVGLYDEKTYGVATSSGNGKDFFLGYSREHTADNLTFQLSGLKLPGKSQVFSGKDVISFEFSNPQKPQNETWRIGFNGSPASQSLKFEKGKAYGLMISFEGNPALRVFNTSLRREYWVNVPEDDDDCAIGCEGGVDCEKYTHMLAEQINNDPYAKSMGAKARTITSDFSLPVTTVSKWRITLNDGCGDNGIGVVQSVVGRAGTVERISKTNCTSVYEVCAATQPAAITPDREYTLTDCDTCASGYTLVPAQDVWTIRRPLSGSDALSTTGAQTTYASTVGTAYGVSVATDKLFRGFDASHAVVEIRVPVGTAISALAADTVEKGATIAAVCQSDTVPSAVSWVSAGTSYRIERTLTISLPRTNCAEDENRLAELTAYVANFADYVPNSIAVNPEDAGDGSCVDTYTISQYSQGCLDGGCLTLDEATFLPFPGFDGEVFEVVPAETLPESGKKCGLEITAGYVDTKYGNCSFDPNEYFETEPITLQITNLTMYPYPTPAEIGNMPKPIRMVKGVLGRQSGEWVARQYIAAGSYEPFGQFYKQPRIREALNSRRLEQVERAADYKIYYLTFKAKRTGQDQYKEQFEATIAIKQTDIAKQRAFEAAILGPLAKFGVTLQQRDA